MDPTKEQAGAPAVLPDSALETVSGGAANAQTSGIGSDARSADIIGDITGGNNPADGELIDCLKDAANAAIYGSRAANGVILIN